MKIFLKNVFSDQNYHKGHIKILEELFDLR